MAAHSLARQIKELRAEITQLAARRSKLSEELKCDPSHLNLLVRVIRKAPEVRPTVMTPELLEMAAEAAKIREIVAEEREAPRKFLSQPRRAPFTQEFPRYELPYPKVKY